MLVTDLKITKVHVALQFLRNPWYVDLNTEKLRVATKYFEQDFFRFLNNSVFGKCMENIRKIVKLDFISDDEK